MHVFRSLDDLAAAVGTDLGDSEPITVDQGRIDGFAEATGGDRWIPTDPESAAQSPFGVTIAHGYLVVSLIPYLARRLIGLEFGHVRINYGLNRVRFLAPIVAGSAVRAGATIVDVRTESSGALLTMRYALSVDGESKPACIAETLTLIR